MAAHEQEDQDDEYKHLESHLMARKIRNPEPLLRTRDTAAVRIGDPFSHRR